MVRSAESRRRVLVVEDEPKLARLLLDYLDRAGYDSDWLDRGEGVLAWVRENGPDLVLLDLMLPGKDGLEICRELRHLGDLPIIMLTARVEEIDRLLGLELGADDYICKPFSPREVMARVRAVLRRSGGSREVVGSSGQVVLEPDRFIARVGANEVELTPVEFRLLEVLMAQPGRVFSRDRLMDKVYTDMRVVSDRTIDSHVKNLRKKLQAAGVDGHAVRSVYGVGYKLDI